MYKKNIFSLKNKKIIILGGSGYIGKNISEEILSHDAQVFVLDKKVNFQNKNITNIYFDANKKNFDKEYKKILLEIGCPDGLVNCLYPKPSSWKKNNIKNINLGSLNKNLNSHLLPFTWIPYATCEQMRKKKIKGSIVQLGSIYGVLGQDLELYKGLSMSENISYSVIKGGIHNFTRQCASIYGKNNIRVNTLVLGGVKDSKMNSKFIAKYSKKTPLGRMCKVSEVSGSVIFLLSNASNYMTGSELYLDGGYSII